MFYLQQLLVDLTPGFPFPCTTRISQRLLALKTFWQRPRLKLRLTPAKGKADSPPAKDNLRPRRQASTNYRVTKKEKNRVASGEWQSEETADGWGKVQTKNFCGQFGLIRNNLFVVSCRCGRWAMDLRKNDDWKSAAN